MADFRSEVFGSITDLTSAESLTFDINPDGAAEDLSVNWARQEVPGLSHRRSQYMSTSNLEISFSLRFDGLIKGGFERVEEAKQFLLSLMYPRRSRRIDGAGAPKCLLILPGTVNAKGFFDSVRITHELYYRNGELRSFTAEIKFSEELDMRKTSQEVRRFRHSSKRPRVQFDFSNSPAFSTRR